jgi:hypothetical protein
MTGISTYPIDIESISLFCIENGLISFSLFFSCDLSPVFIPNSLSRTKIWSSYRVMAIVYPNFQVPIPIFFPDSSIEDAILLASSPNTKVEMFLIDDRILCCQAHPEFDPKMMKERILPDLASSSFYLFS